MWMLGEWIYPKNTLKITEDYLALGILGFDSFAVTTRTIFEFTIQPIKSVTQPIQKLICLGYPIHNNASNI